MNLFNRNKTLKPVKSHARPGDSKLSDFAKHTLSTLGAMSMKLAVQLPKGEEVNEWLCVNTVDFFNEISMLYGTISEYCDTNTCPTMSAGPNFQYLWADGVKVKKPIACSAPEYVDYLLSWVNEQSTREFQALNH
jgi:MOB kinase activator 1